ncbi:MAG: 4a-hydroxytetrahydrobiopterin dehydratase [Flavobacteriaceae bacterium]|nr:4a-hydroxytetrahydrobiopterin dehydratase [Flavobacteriaceae bacterium]MCY4253719.1 4a-hydroxytetrahydrobiopterin dehydratase [Flavobacteriaceae bacterium]
MKIKSQNQINRFLNQQNQNWSTDDDGYLKLELVFKNYIETYGQVSKIALISEQLNHHPTMIVDYNKLVIKIKTHSENAITDKDFEFVEKINQTLSTS